MRKIHPFRKHRSAATGPIDLAAVGHLVAEQGPAAARRPLAEVHRHAKVLGVAPFVVDLLIDPTVPDVVRARALANVSIGITRHTTGRATWAA